MEVRTLSVRQPWASLLLSGVKRYECRGWCARRPGVMLVHASSGKSEGMPELRRERLFQEALRGAGLEDARNWPFSAIIGAVEITRFWEPNQRPRGFTTRDRYLTGDLNTYLWEVGRRWPFATPVRCHGKLNLWRPDPKTHAALDVQLAALAVPLDRLCA